MKPKSQYLPPRQSVIYGHTRRMLDSTALCVRKFSTCVAEKYIELVAPAFRQVPFRWGVTVDDMFKAEKHNAQIIARYMDGTVKALPVDLEDAWIQALPLPFRDECERDLARRRDQLIVKLDRPSEYGLGAVSIGSMLLEMGQLCDALAPAMADNTLTPEDQKHAVRILNEADDMIGAVSRLRDQILPLLPKVKI